MNNRAYSILDVKSIREDEEWVTVTGIASTPTADRIGDVVEPLGARFKTPMPLLWQHNADKPVGRVMFAQPTKTGIPFEAQLPVVREAGALKDRIDEAVQSIKYKLVAAVSIGFKAVSEHVEQLKTGGLRFKEWEWLELSLVTIPANSEAVINTIKAIDSQHLPAIGQTVETVVPVSPGASGTKLAHPGYVKLIPRKRR